MIYKTIELDSDFIVVGGGLAGICAAISAARLNLKVILCHDRPVLGGNSSSEFRVHACGATGLGNNRYAEETGIINELILENLYRNKEGNPYLWDAILLDHVLAESNIKLLLNARMQDVVMEDGRIEAIICYQNSTEKKFICHASIFADCTGDGLLSVLGEAQYVYGTEGISEDDRKKFGMDENEYSLGSTLLFYVKQNDKPVKYIPPNYVYSKEEIENILEKTDKTISPADNGCAYWWLEYGGDRHIIYDSEDIAHELHKIIYGIWDYVKNSGNFDADHLTLEWVGSIPARRESRRIISKYMLQHEELIMQKPQHDAVGHGGWPIDTHPQLGFFDKREACRQIPVGVYDIPLRSLCCRDIDNVVLAGRDAGMTHIAMASARIMKTCSIMGQAVGTAAAIAKKVGKMPFKFSAEDIESLQQRLIRDDVWIIGRKNLDRSDLARQARITGSPGIALGSDHLDDLIPLEKPAHIILPPLLNALDISVYLSSSGEGAVDLSLWDSIDLENHVPKKLLAQETISIIESGWFSIGKEKETQGNLVLSIKKISGDVKIGVTSDEYPGVLGVFGKNTRGLQVFKPSVRISPDQKLFEVAKINDGFSRPYGDMHLWASEMKENGAYIELELMEPSNLSQIEMYLDCGLYRDYNNLNPRVHFPNWDRIHQNLAKEILVELISRNSIQEILISENHQRHIRKKVDSEAIVKVRVAIRKTWGGRFAAIHEIRLYGSEK